MNRNWWPNYSAMDSVGHGHEEDNPAHAHGQFWNPGSSPVRESLPVDEPQMSPFASHHIQLATGTNQAAAVAADSRYSSFASSLFNADELANDPAVTATQQLVGVKEEEEEEEEEDHKPQAREIKQEGGESTHHLRGKRHSLSHDPFLGRLYHSEYRQDDVASRRDVASDESIHMPALNHPASYHSPHLPLRRGASLASGAVNPPHMYYPHAVYPPPSGMMYPHPHPHALASHQQHIMMRHPPQQNPPQHVQFRFGHAALASLPPSGNADDISTTQAIHKKKNGRDDDCMKSKDKRVAAATRKSSRGAKKPPPLSTSQRASFASALTRSGERTSQFRRSPTMEEARDAKTPRAKEALYTWYKRLEDLIQYKEENGNCNVPQKYSPNPALGIWVNKQRMEKKFLEEGKKSSMTTPKLQALESLGFVWARRKGQPSWNIRFNELVEYRKEHGDCNVPTKYVLNPALGRWVSTQRSQAKQLKSGYKTQMTQQRVDKLNEIGFRWNMMDREEEEEEETEEENDSYYHYHGQQQVRHRRSSNGSSNSSGSFHHHGGAGRDIGGATLEHV